MRLQNEQIPYVNIESMIDSIFSNSQHSKRKQSLANAVLGIVNSASLIVHRIGLVLAAAKKLYGKHAVKQVDRLLSNDKLSLSACFEKMVPYVIGARKAIVLAMDWTDFNRDQQATLQLSLVTTHGRATPLMWKTVSKKQLKNKRNDYEDDLLCALHSFLPAGVKVTILADRGFGDTKLYDFLRQELGFDFVIRFRGNIQVTHQRGETRKALDWVGTNGRAKTLRGARVTALSCEVPTVVCVKQSGMKQAWCLAASDPKASASILIRWYAKRWGIEPQFRDTKD